MKLNAAVLQDTYAQLVNVTEHKQEVNICINGIQKSQLKEISTLVTTHCEKNQMWNVTPFIVVQQMCRLFHIVWHSYSIFTSQTKRWLENCINAEIGPLLLLSVDTELVFPLCKNTAYSRNPSAPPTFKWSYSYSLVFGVQQLNLSGWFFLTFRKTNNE